MALPTSATLALQDKIAHDHRRTETSVEALAASLQDNLYHAEARVPLAASCGEKLPHRWDAGKRGITNSPTASKLDGHRNE